MTGVTFQHRSPRPRLTSFLTCLHPTIPLPASTVNRRLLCERGLDSLITCISFSIIDKPLSHSPLPPPPTCPPPCSPNAAGYHLILCNVGNPASFGRPVHSPRCSSPSAKHGALEPTKTVIIPIVRAVKLRKRQKKCPDC